MTRTEWKRFIGVGERQIGLTDKESERVAVEHENGGIAGFQIYHRDGRVDAEVHARPIKTEHSKREWMKMFGHL